MVMTEVKTEKVTGRINEVIIGYNASNGTKIKQGILSFEYNRVKDLLRMKIPGATTANVVQDLGMSSYNWKLRFIGDCRLAFFATDVQSASGNQFAMSPNGYSNKIEYFLVVMSIEDANGYPKTRTYTITNGYALRNNAVIGDDKDTEYVYEGDAEYISYSDS